MDALAVEGGTQVASFRLSRMLPRGCCVRMAGFGGIRRDADSSAATTPCGGESGVAGDGTDMTSRMRGVRGGRPTVVLFARSRRRCLSMVVSCEA